LIPLLSSTLIPLVDDLVYWVQYQVRTMDDGTFTLAIAGLVVVMGLAMMGLRPKR
jgi:hypothetical protein